MLFNEWHCKTHINFIMTAKLFHVAANIKTDGRDTPTIIWDKQEIQHSVYLEVPSYSLLKYIITHCIRVQKKIMERA